MKYNLDDKPKAGPLLLYALQWWVVIIPSVITIGLVVGKFHFGADQAAQVLYMQKLFLVLGLTMLVQAVAGHRLPLVSGPASVLLIGIVASSSASMPAIYTAIMAGGILLASISALGLMKHMHKVFTTRVVVVIMFLIPITLGPTIVKLIFGNAEPVLFNLLFATGFGISLLAANNLLRGVWKSATPVIGIVAATLLHRLCFPAAAAEPAPLPSGTENILPGLAFEPGVMISFLCCAVALMINEVGSIEAVGQILSADKMEGRTRRGMIVTGLGNIFSGAVGVIGPIDYSSSPGIIASTGCASRFPFIPAAIMLAACAFVPQFVRGLLAIPDLVMGTILLYVMISQFSAGFRMAVDSRAIAGFNDGAAIGISLMVALLVSFIPAELAAQMPALIRPITGNGFVMGVITILLMEHVVYRGRKESPPTGTSS